MGERHLHFPAGRIDELLSRRGWTVSMLARKMGVSSQAVCNWRDGHCQPYRTKLEEFLDVFGFVSEAELYGSPPQGRRPARTDLLPEYAAELAALGSSRQDFWEAVRVGYEVYVGRCDDRDDWPVSLEALAENAPPPPGVPVASGEDLRFYPILHGRMLTGWPRRLYDFGLAVYPSKQRNHHLADLSIIPRDRFDRFHSARLRHAKLWNRIGRCVVDGSLEMEAVRGECASQRIMLNLLSYLEIALTGWCEGEGPGKEYLFRLNKEWHQRTFKNRSPLTAPESTRGTHRYRGGQ